jgi:flagellar biosynthesis protein FlhG
MSDAAVQLLVPPSDQASRLRALVETAAPAPVRRRAKVLTISSGKGGVGKTTASVSLSIAMTQLGWRTTLLDADLGMANADVLCGLTPTRRLEQFVGVSDRTRAVGAPSRLEDIAIDAPGGFRLIPGSVGVARMAELAAHERTRLMGALDELEEDTELLIVDTGAGLGREVLSFMHSADLALVIATPEPTSIADAYALIKCALLGGAGPPGPRLPVPEDGRPALPRIGLVVNQVSSKKEADAVHARIASVCHRFLHYRLPCLGWVAQDGQVGAAVRKRKPLILDEPRCQASRDLRRLACVLVENLELRHSRDQRLGNRLSGLSGLWSRLTLRGG